VSRYEEGQKYEAHFDSAPDQKLFRRATMIVYLSDVEEGGETMYYQKSKGLSCAPLDESGCCEFDKTGYPKAKNAIDDTLLVRPKKGSAVLFYSHSDEGRGNKKYS
jgi:hypothetical protein